jgi:uncharacterized protein YbjT (DUF2867 family)
MEKTALVIGATGLVGAELISQLLADGAYGRVIAFTRRDTGVEHDKLTTHIIDFDDRDAWAPLVRGHVLFSTLGTTAKVAGSKEAQFRIDHDYQLWFAEAARDNGVESLVLVSAMGADANSVVFYSRMKGQLERAVRALEIPRTVILQPGMLDGPRKEKRPAERLALGVMRNMPGWDCHQRRDPYTHASSRPPRGPRRAQGSERPRGEPRRSSDAANSPREPERRSRGRDDRRY